MGSREELSAMSEPLDDLHDLRGARGAGDARRAGQARHADFVCLVARTASSSSLKVGRSAVNNTLRPNSTAIAGAYPFIDASSTDFTHWNGLASACPFAASRSASGPKKPYESRMPRNVPTSAPAIISPRIAGAAPTEPIVCTTPITAATIPNAGRPSAIFWIAPPAHDVSA